MLPALLVLTPAILPYNMDDSNTARAIHAARETATTDVISFSPINWPIERHPWHPDLVVFKINIMQRSCRMTHTDALSCYFEEAHPGTMEGANSAFNRIDADTDDSKYSLHYKTNIDAERTTGLLTMGKVGSQWWLDACGKAEINGTYQSIPTLHVAAYKLHPECAWTPQDPRYMKALPARTVSLSGETFTYDYSFQVCTRAGVCKAQDFDCINAYTAFAVANPEATNKRNLIRVTSGGLEVMYFPKQRPSRGAGTVSSVYAIPEEGPYLPCPVDADGVQQPCADLPANSSEMPAGWQPVAEMVLHINPKPFLILSIKHNKWTFEAEYDIEWSSRFAVHPCTIDLYPVGRGVPSTGKVVEASNWWTPRPGQVGADTASYTSRSKLKVMEQPGQQVMTECTLATCPWPKQLWLKDTIKTKATFESTWNYLLYPFDTQVLRANILAVDNVPDAADYSRMSLGGALLNELSLTAEQAASTYTGDDWKICSVEISIGMLGGAAPLGPACAQHPHMCLDIRVKVTRNAVSGFLKVVVPALLLAQMAVMAAGSGSSALGILSLLAVADVAMLNPVVLGLPEDTRGVPMVMLLVIVHLAVVVLVLVVFQYLKAKEGAAAGRGDDFRKARRPALSKHWKRAWEQKRSVELAVGMDVDMSQDVEDGEPMSSTKNQVVPIKPDAENQSELSTTAPSSGDPITLLTKAVLTLPTLFHYAAQSLEAKPTHPNGAGEHSGKDWLTGEEKAIVPKHEKIAEKLSMVAATLFVILWSIIMVVWSVLVAQAGGC